MKTLNNDNDNNNNNRKIPLLHNTYIATTTTATIFTLAIIFASTTTLVSASTIGNTTTTTTTSSSGIELSPQPVLQLRASTTGVTPINQTHIGSTFSANGTLTLPNTTETINITTNGSALTSLATQSAIGTETIMTEDGETAIATFYEIVELTPTGGGNGIAIAVLHTNSTGRLAPLDGMILAATDYMQPLGEAVTTFWEWVPSPPLPPTTMEESPPSPMNATTTTDATTSDANATTATEEEQQQQQQTTPTIPAPLLE
jgi:hypothetical protein